MTPVSLRVRRAARSRAPRDRIRANGNPLANLLPRPAAAPARSVSLLTRLRRQLWVLRTTHGAARRWALRRLFESPSARATRLAALSAAPASRLVFICHGNIMRSAFATAVARGQQTVAPERVVGAGTHATAGRAAQDSALTVSRELGVPLDAHVASPLAAVAPSAGDVLVCMDAVNEANVLAAYPALAARVFRVGDVAAGDVTGAIALREVRDPYGQGDDATRAAFSTVQQLAGKWLRHLRFE